MPVLDDAERKAALEAMQKSARERLRDGLSKVSRLEQPGGTLSDLQKRIDDEIRRYGGRAPELDE